MRNYQVCKELKETLYGLFQSVLNLQKTISSKLSKNAFSPKTFLMGTHSSGTVTKNIITDSRFLSLNLIKVFVFN